MNNLSYGNIITYCLSHIDIYNLRFHISNNIFCYKYCEKTSMSNTTRFENKVTLGIHLAKLEEGMHHVPIVEVFKYFDTLQTNFYPYLNNIILVLITIKANRDISE